MSKHVMAVATYHQLLKGADGFTKDGMREIRPASLVPRRTIAKINDNYKNTGKWYEVDEAETDRRYKLGEERAIEVAAAEEDAAELSNLLSDQIKQVKKGNSRRKKSKKQKDVEVDSADSDESEEKE